MPPGRRKKACKKAKVLLLGVGSVLLTDDGVGVRGAEYAASNHKSRAIDVVDGGTGGLSLLSIVKDYENVVIMDAVKMGLEPGAIRSFSLAPGKKSSRQARRLSGVHGVGVEEMLDVMEIDGKSPKVVIVGMEPFFVGPGLSLSPDAERLIPEFALAAVKEAEKLAAGTSARPKRGVRCR